MELQIISEFALDDFPMHLYSNKRYTYRTAYTYTS